MTSWARLLTQHCLPLSFHFLKNRSNFCLFLILITNLNDYCFILYCATNIERYTVLLLNGCNNSPHFASVYCEVVVAFNWCSCCFPVTLSTVWVFLQFLLSLISISLWWLPSQLFASFQQEEKKVTTAGD